MRQFLAPLDGIPHFKILFIGIMVTCLAICPETNGQVNSPKPPSYKPALKDLDGHFPLSVPSSLSDWEKRATEVRQQLRVALGVYPAPELAPLHPIIHSPKKMDGYTVENVILESLPGLYITGNLFRPSEPASGKRPAMLCAHGHWDNARFYDLGPKERKRLLATGEERFENAARNHLQAKCVQLARMGCVVFFWDMLGYCDSQQISFQRAHRFAKLSPEEATNEKGWVLFSPEAEGHYQSVIGIQAIHSMRAMDFILSLPEVDPTRVGMTGASGGGSQTFLAAAIEPRLTLAFPAVMVSTGMQGGCTCENASGLRIHTGNVEIAGLFAPKPLGMTAADDWTRNMHVDGFPELKKLYSMYGAADKVGLFPSLHFGHNYNHVSRVALYGWVNKHFKLGLEEPVLERDFEYLSGKELTVWNAEHPKPEGGLDFERKLLRQWKAATQKQLLSGSDPAAIRNGLGSGWDVLLAPAAQLIANYEATPKMVGGAPAMILQDNDQIVAIVQEDVNKNRNGSRVVLAIAHGDYDAKSKSISSESDSSRKARERIAASGRGSSIVANFYSLEDGAVQPLVGNPRRSAAYTYGYNPPRHVRVTAGLAKMASGYSTKNNTKITLWATGDDAMAAAAAAKLRPEAVGEIVIVDDGSRLADAKDVDDPNLVPGSLRFLDWPGLVASLLDVKVKILQTGKGKGMNDWDLLKEKGLLQHVEFVAID